MKKLIATIASMAFFCFLLTGTVGAQTEASPKKNKKTEASATSSETPAAHSCTKGSGGSANKSCCANKGGGSASAHEGCTKGKASGTQCNKSAAGGHKCDEACKKGCTHTEKSDK